MDSQHTDGTGALAPSLPTEAQERRRSFRLVSYDDRHKQEAEEIADMLEVVDATEEIDWQLRKWLHVQDELRNAKEREAAAKQVREHYEGQADQLTEFITGECREKYEELIAREHKGKSRFTDHGLAAAGRRDLVVRVGLRALPPQINVWDEDLLISQYTDQIEGPGQLKDDATAPLKWVEPTEGHWVVDKLALNKQVRGGEDLPGVEIIPKPDKLYFEDKSRKDK